MGLTLRDGFIVVAPNPTLDHVGKWLAVPHLVLHEGRILVKQSGLAGTFVPRIHVVNLLGGEGINCHMHGIEFKLGDLLIQGLG